MENTDTKMRFITCFHTVMRIFKLKIFPVPVQLHSGYGKLIFVIISPFFALFKNVVHCLDPDETPSYSASHQAPNYAKRSLIYQNILKRLRLIFQFTYAQYCITVALLDLPVECVHYQTENKWG